MGVRVAGGDGRDDNERALRPDVPGWYPDPWSATGTGERYWDGTRWLTTERPRGRGNSGTVVDLDQRRRRSSRRRSWLWAAFGIVVVGAVLVFGVSQSSDDRDNAVRAPDGTDAVTPASTSTGATTTAPDARASTLEPGK